LHFKVGFDLEQFVADFDSTIKDFLLVEITFTDEFQTVAFLDKITHTVDPGTMYISFYNITLAPQL